MIQKTSTFTVRCLDSNEELGVFVGHEAALAFCLENNLTFVTIPHGFQFESPLPLPDNPTDFVMFVFSREVT
jgi:hypothetical protein